MSISQQHVFFRAGAGALIYRGKQVLMFRRSGTNHAQPHAWQFPQGGLDPNEDAESGMWRELFEETALSQDMFKKAVAYPNWIGYEYDHNTKDALKSRGITNTGQVQRWWFLEIHDDVTIDLDQAQDQEFDDYQWVDIDTVLDRVVPFKQDMYRTLIGYVQQHSGL